VSSLASVQLGLLELLPWPISAHCVCGFLSSTLSNRAKTPHLVVGADMRWQNRCLCYRSIM
jgi:hypothetical protein